MARLTAIPTDDSLGAVLITLAIAKTRTGTLGIATSVGVVGLTPAKIFSQLIRERTLADYLLIGSGFSKNWGGLLASERSLMSLRLVPMSWTPLRGTCSTAPMNPRAAASRPS